MNVLLVGIGTDGPTNLVTKPADSRSMLRLYGATALERHSITSTASSIALRYEPYQIPNNIVTTARLGARENYLYLPAVSGSVLLFGAIGGSGATVDLSYTPYLGKSDLIFAARKYLEVTGATPYICRVGGTTASGTVGDWSFKARYPGSKYNNVTIVYDGTTMTVSGLVPEYPVCTYTASAFLIPQLIQREADLGLCPVLVESSTYTLSPFSLTLQGGQDDVLTDQTFQDFLDNTAIPGECSHVLFLSQLSSGMVSTLATAMSFLEEQPRIYFIPAPTFTSPLSSFLLNTQSSIPYRQAMIASIVGETTVVLNGKEVTRYATESAALGLARSGGTNMTNLPVPAISFTPNLSEADMIQLKQAGWMVITRYIGNDIAVYEGCITSNTNSFLYSSKAAEIFAIAKSYLFKFIGQPMQDGQQPALEAELIRRLTPISFITVEQVFIAVLGPEMRVIITVLLPGEILSINFVVKSK